MIFKNTSTLKNLLINNIPVNNNYSCIYKIPCKDCDKVYIGQTGASLATRISQHKSYIRAADDRKSVFAHMSSNYYNIAFDQVSVVKFSNTSFNRTIIESALIKYQSEKLYNIHPGPYRRFNAIVSQLKMHYFSGGAFESLISSQLLKKEKYI